MISGTSFLITNIARENLTAAINRIADDSRLFAGFGRVIASKQFT
jgi:hypothetical protein